MPIHLAVCSELFAERPLAEAISAATDCGYVGLEIDGPRHLPAETPAAQVDQAAKAMERAGFEVVTLISGLGGFAAQSDAESERDLETLRRYLEMADVLECDMVQVAAGGPPDIRDARQDHWDRAAFYLAEACDLALGAGLGIVLANDWGLTGTVDAALQLAGDVDRPNLGLNYNPALLYLAGKQYGLEALERYGELLWNVRIGDAVKSTGAPGFAPLGEGELDLHRVLGWLVESEYDGYVTVGAAVPAGTASGADFAKREAEALRHLLKGTRGG